MSKAPTEIILYLRERSDFYGLRAKQRHGTQADRDRAISRAYREDAGALEFDKADAEAPE